MLQNSVDNVRLQPAGGQTAEKARAEIFQKDGINLTTKGVNFFNKNIINVITKCYPETLQLQKQEVRGQGVGRSGSNGRLQGQARGRGQAAAEGGRDEGAGRGHRPRGWGGDSRAGQRNRRSDQWQYPPPGWGGQTGNGWVGDR